MTRARRRIRGTGQGVDTGDTGHRVPGNGAIMTRHLLADHGLGQIPKILTLLDRNRHSPTYGCFDRNFWHYRTVDFPSGIVQELVLPLALAYSLDIPGSPFHRREALREWVEAGILFAARSAHGDASCDDFFPFERAGGATAFSLLGCMEAYSLLGLNNETALGFFERRADWLAGHRESGRLTNHQALTAQCLCLAGKLLGTAKWEGAVERKIARVLSWQNAEGWFQEYEGCDPGYHTLTISILAGLHALGGRRDLEEALTRAVRFAAHFVHPDGSFGGEYGSRNTYSFFPHGFELVGRWLPEALAVTDGFLAGLERGLEPSHSDDHIIGHAPQNYLLAWRDFVPDRPAPKPRPPGRTWFKDAKLLVDRRADFTLYVALNKGGVFKIFRQDRLVASDTQLSVKVKKAPGGNAVGHLIDGYDISVGDDEITVEGRLGWAKTLRMTPAKFVLSRLFMLSVGRFCPGLVRRLLQPILITGKRDAPFRFRRTFRWTDGAWTVKDRLEAESWKDVEEVGIGCDQTSIYVAMSRPFQSAQLHGWTDLSTEVKKLKAGQALEVVRTF